MELYVEMLKKMLEADKVEVVFPNLTLSPRDMLDSVSYCALNQIRAILRNDALSDPECFRQIEAIVNVLEQLGSDCGNRHRLG